ncbi:type III secretion system HrpP C-terminal domain-containing protein [Dickeya fangzhongdai]|uniref:type III secretion system HrpP C-terminal domain-containing protein n=1 Tax=Dickeya fangzhongdai TaxID=1778540 RepID=UPI0026DFA332|nr:type III secretion system HrpP C-terminal domain-containing protein [Dickeya fangzhongdai]WKV50818.1 type III secretion system HrpP C-terminal domain-containing protein [Dickeya fangzhongdai]
MTPHLPATQDVSLPALRPLPHGQEQDFPGYGYDDGAFWEPFGELSEPEMRFPDASWLPFGPPLALNPSLNLDAFADAPSQSEPVTPAYWPALESSLTDMPLLRRGEPLSFSLQLPQLGSVDVRMVTLPASGWDVSLRFGKSAYEQLKSQRDACRRSLADTLCAPVRLQFESREDEE